MIYLKNNSETQELYIPKNGDYQGKRTYKEGFEEGIEYQKSKLSSIEIKENGLYQNEDGYNEVLVDVLGADNANIRTLYAFDNGEYTPNNNHILFDGTTYISRTYGIGYNGGFTLIFKIPSGVANSTILSDRNGIMYIKHEDSNINIKVGDKTGSIAIERDKWHILEIVGFDTYLLDNKPIPTQGETNLDADGISAVYLGSLYDYENRTYTDRFQGCINLVIFNEGEGKYIYYLIPNQDNGFTQVSTNGERWNKINITIREGATFVEESAENILWNKALVRYFINLTSPTFDIEGYDFTNTFTTPEGYDGMTSVNINNLKQASNIMRDGNNINLNTIIDPNIFEITENGSYTPNMEVIPTVWFMDDYTTYGWDITDIQQERIEVRFLVTPEMIKGRSCWVFGKTDGRYVSDDPQIFGLEITGDDSIVKAKYYQNGLKQEININYHTWIDFITYPHPDNTEIRIIECSEQYFEVENSAFSTDGSRVTKCVIGGLGTNRNNSTTIKSNTQYFGMLSYIKVSTDSYNKETTIQQTDIGRIAIGFEGEPIKQSYNLSYYEFYRNGGFGSINVNVPQEGGDINPDILREITITENGRYTSKYSEPIKTGEFEDGTPFYGYGIVNSAVYDTNITGNQNTKLEFWWKPDGDVSPYRTVLGFQVDGGMIMKICESYSGDELIYEYGNAAENSGNFAIKNDDWNHIIFSKADGIIVNDLKITDLTADWFGDVYPNILINASYQNEIDYNANGYFGMIKINGNIIIPTENGFMNYNTQTILSTLKEGSYEYGTNEVDEGEPYKTINVNIPPANLQEKYEWRGDTEGYFTILPDEGYVGMSKVDVDINTPLQSKYDEGKVQGENEIKSLMTTLNVEKNGTYQANSFNVMDIDNDDAFEMDLGRSEDCYFEIKFKINRNGSRIEGALLTIYDCDGGNWNGIYLDSDSQISFKWYDKYGSASIDPNGWNIIRFSPNNTDTSKRVWVNGESVEVNEGGENNYTEDCSYSNMCIGGRSPYGLTTGAFDLAYVHYFMNYQYGWEEGHTPFYYLPEANNQISRCSYFGDGIAWLERDGEVGWNEVIVDVPQGGGGDITSSIVEDTYSVLALRTENVDNSNIIKDRTQLVGSGDEYTENGFISYTQNKNGIVISGTDELGAKYVTKIRKDALNWDTIEYFYSYTIVNFGVDMTRDTGSNVMEIHIKYNGGVGSGISNDIYFRTGCFATSNRLNKIVFYEPYYINVEENAFEGVSSSGEVIVVGEDNVENRAKYDTLMSQLGDGWTLSFVNE